MTPEEINVAIAKSLEWQLYGADMVRAPDGLLYPIEAIPDYYRSLDACREFELALANDYSMFLRYDASLESVVGSSNVIDLMLATPAQKCEAYLRTIWKWEVGE